jgi:hypothetical protein
MLGMAIVGLNGLGSWIPNHPLSIAEVEQVSLGLSANEERLI